MIPMQHDLKTYLSLVLLLIFMTHQSCVHVKNITKKKYHESVSEEHNDEGELVSRTKKIVYYHRPVNS